MHNIKRKRTTPHCATLSVKSLLSSLSERAVGLLGCWVVVARRTQAALGTVETFAAYVERRSRTELTPARAKRGAVAKPCALATLEKNGIEVSWLFEDTFHIVIVGLFQFYLGWWRAKDHYCLDRLKAPTRNTRNEVTAHWLFKASYSYRLWGWPPLPSTFSCLELEMVFSHHVHLDVHQFSIMIQLDSDSWLLWGFKRRRHEARADDVADPRGATT